MLELLVATAMRDFVPAILRQTLDDLPAGHKIRYTLYTHLSSRDGHGMIVSFQAARSVQSRCQARRSFPRSRLGTDPHDAHLDYFRIADDSPKTSPWLSTAPFLNCLPVLQHENPSLFAISAAK
jgi:hypothetical protein